MEQPSILLCMFDREHKTAVKIMDFPFYIDPLNLPIQLRRAV